MIFLFVDASIYYTLILNPPPSLSDVAFDLHSPNHLFFIVAVYYIVGNMISG